jgi:putative intracellular protease/amidase
MNVLMILTSHDKLGDTGKKIGFWLEEFAAPYYVLLDAEAKITLASPAGGHPPLGPQSDVPDAQTAANGRFRMTIRPKGHSVKRSSWPRSMPPSSM